MLFKYLLTEGQYNRFQHSTNDEELRVICAKAGVRVTGEQLVGGVETWFFTGRCKGTMALVREDGSWYCVVQVRSKPWWLPWFVLDWGFREALK